MSHENEIWSAVLELILEKFDRRFTYDLWFSELQLKKLKMLENQGYLTFENDIISLTPKGFLMENAISCEIML